MDAFVHDVVFPILSMLLTALAAMLIQAMRLWLKKQGLDVEAKEYRKGQTIAESAVLMAEEEVESSDLAPRVDKSAAKRDRAVATIQAQMPEVSAERATELVQEAVARIPGLGASGDVTTARS